MAQVPQKGCPKCSTPAALDAAFCSRCGHQFRTQFTNQTQIITPPAQQAPPPQYPPEYYNPTPFRPWYDIHGIDDAPRANTALIASMWLITVLNMGLFLAYPQVAIVCDCGAVVMAVFLVCSKNQTDKSNGWAKIILEIIAGIFAFLWAYQRARSGY